MKLSAFVSSLLLLVSAIPLWAGVQGLITIYQPLTTEGTDQELAVIVAPVSVIAAGASEELLAMIARPNRLPQSKGADIADSNLLSRLGITLRIQTAEEPRRYVVTLDLAAAHGFEKFGVTVEEVIAAAVECIRRTMEETRLYHPSSEALEWELKLSTGSRDATGLRHWEKLYSVPPRPAAPAENTLGK